MPVLDEGQAEGDGGTGENQRRHRGDELVEDREPLAVEGVGASLLAQPDGDHLGEAALDLPREVGMGLDTVDWDDDVGVLKRLAVDEDGHSGMDLTQGYRVHAGADLAAHGLGGDAIGGEKPELALGGRAPVAAHRGHQEDGGAGLPDALDDRPHHLVDAIDPPAAHGHADAGLGSDARHERVDLAAHRLPDIHDLGRVDALADQGPLGQRPGQQLLHPGTTEGGSTGRGLRDRGVAQLVLRRRFTSGVGASHPHAPDLLGHRWMRADPPWASARTWASVAMVVSPGKVVSRAPCAQPRRSASSIPVPVMRP